MIKNIYSNSFTSIKVKETTISLTIMKTPKLEHNTYVEKYIFIYMLVFLLMATLNKAGTKIDLIKSY